MEKLLARPYSWREVLTKSSRNGNPNRRRGLLHVLRRSNKIIYQPTKLLDNIQLHPNPTQRLVQRKRCVVGIVAVHIKRKIAIGRGESASRANNLVIKFLNSLTGKMRQSLRQIF